MDGEHTGSEVSRPAGWSYSGEAWTDERGHAVVVLPAFVRLQHGFDYELEPASARVAEEIVEDRFTIATEEPHVKVAWRVTARTVETKTS